MVLLQKVAETFIDQSLEGCHTIACERVQRSPGLNVHLDNLTDGRRTLPSLGRHGDNSSKNQGGGYDDEDR
jgi:hypothetical protein